MPRQPVKNPIEAIFVKGEKLECKYNLKEVSQSNLIGDLFLTNYRLIFKPNGTKLDECMRYSVPYGVIQKLQESSNTDKTSCSITVTCKDERVMKFKFENVAPVFLHSVKILRKYSLCQKIEQLFCVTWSSLHHTDWKKVSQSTAEDLERLGIPARFRLYKPLDQKTSKVPRLCYVNKEVSDKQLSEIQRVRREGRFPTVCYMHTGSSLKTGLALYRCAEPEPALNIDGSPDDLYYLSLMAKVEGSEDPDKDMLQVFSARPEVQTSKSKSAAKNFEPTAKHGFESSQYQQVVRNSYNLDYKAIQDSYVELCVLSLKQIEEACPSKNFLSKMVKTDWLGHLQNIL